MCILVLNSAIVDINWCLLSNVGSMLAQHLTLSQHWTNFGWLFRVCLIYALRMTTGYIAYHSDKVCYSSFIVNNGHIWISSTIELENNILPLASTMYLLKFMITNFVFKHITVIFYKEYNSILVLNKWPTEAGTQRLHSKLFVPVWKRVYLLIFTLDNPLIYLINQSIHWWINVEHIIIQSIDCIV